MSEVPLQQWINAWGCGQTNQQDDTAFDSEGVGKDEETDSAEEEDLYRWAQLSD